MKNNIQNKDVYMHNNGQHILHSCMFTFSKYKDCNIYYMPEEENRISRQCFIIKFSYGIVILD